MSGIGIITNPHSKLNKRNPNRTAMLGYILGAKGQLEVTNTLADLGRVAKEFRAQGISTLAINGGDGTICRTLTAFIKEYSGSPLPQVALLRGGTINVLANNLRVRGAPEQVLYRLIEWHSSGQAFALRRLKSLEVEGNYGFLFGTGAAAAFLKEYYKRKSGPVGAAYWAFRVYASRFFGSTLYDRVVRDQCLTIQSDRGPALPHSTCALFAATVAKMPLGYPLFPGMRTQPNCFQVVSFTFTARDAVWQLPVTMLKMQDGSTKGKLSLCCRELDVSAAQPFDYTLDGELYVSRSPELQIRMGPDIEFVIV